MTPEQDKIANRISDALFERLKLIDTTKYTQLDTLKVRLLQEMMVYLIAPVRVFGTDEVVEILRAIADSLELAHKEGLN